MNEIEFRHFKSTTMQVKVYKNGREVWTFMDFPTAYNFYHVIKSLGLDDYIFKFTTV